MKKRVLYLIILPILLFILAFSMYVKSVSPDSFDKLCHDILYSELKKDSLGLHFTYVNPEKAGFEMKHTQLPLYSKRAKQSEYRQLSNFLNALNKIDAKELSIQEANTLSILKNSLQTDLNSKQFFYLQGYFSPSSGVQIEFPLLMAEYTFYSKEDVSQYLELLSLFPMYVDSLLKHEEERTQKGFGLPNFTIEKVVAQCEEFYSPLLNHPDSHFLVSEFSNRLLNLVESDALSEEEYQKYIKENYKILIEDIVPTYQKIESVMAGFLDTGKNSEGLCHYKNGKEYYKYLFYSTTNSSADIDEVYTFLARNYYNLNNSIQTDYDLFLKTCSLSSSELAYFPLSTPQEMLTHLHEQMRADFPPLSTDLTPAKQVQIKKVADNLKKHTAPAYYFIPPLDFSSSNSIYINPSANLEGISLYTTLAHEGFPGHLYQTNFFSTYMKQNNINDIRGILNYGGYVEGWALYTELLSYDYASALLTETTGNSDYALIYKLYKNDKQSSLALLSLLDIAIHYYGIPYERVCELLQSHGITDTTTQKEIYEYILEEPCNYLKYYWGYQEILQLKEYMKKIQGELYTDYGFHKFYLENGPSDFSHLYQKLQLNK